MSSQLTAKNYWLKVGIITFLAALHIVLCCLGYSVFGSEQSSANLWLTLFFAIALFLPSLSSKRIFLVMIVSVLMLGVLNYLKLRYLNHAISEYDFKIIASAPFYCLDAIFGYGFWHYFIVVFLLGLAVLFVIKSYRQFVSMTLALIIFSTHYSFYQKNLQEYHDNYDVLGSIAYSGSNAYFSNINSLIKKQDDQNIIDETEIEIVAKKYVTHSRKELKPNIVFVLAESTFNPNETFILLKSYQDNSLFFAKKNEYYGKLGVSVTGGGTWVTEFETNSGISTKALGFSDHVNGMIASRIKTSFASYLKEKAYYSTAFFPTLGAFVDSAKTYKENYGFDAIEDIKTLGLEEYKGQQGFDLKMMEKVMEKLPKDSKNPFFSYVILLENHGPHYCKRKILHKDEFKFAYDSSFDHNCELDEYLKRARSTESAIQLLQDEMRKIEIKTNRPFIIVVFGDHQPWTFNAKSYDIDRIKGSSRYTTFYKIIKSDSISLPKVPKFIPTNLLPSITSSVFTNNPKELYIPENFYLFEKCGVFENADECLSELGSKHLDYGKYFEF